MFELADTWTDRIAAEDYHGFMTTVLLDAISAKDRDGARRYRSDAELKGGKVSKETSYRWCPNSTNEYSYRNTNFNLPDLG
jgi:hypothetical protein